MFVLAHLLVGILIGILLYLWRRERWLILAAAVGSILPDLIDKPLGQIVLAGSVNFGRIYFHSLIFLLAFIIAGVLIWWKYRSFIGIALALGVLSHQVLDRMWAEYLELALAVLRAVPGRIDRELLPRRLAPGAHEPLGMDLRPRNPPRADQPPQD